MPLYRPHLSNHPKKRKNDHLLLQLSLKNHIAALELEKTFPSLGRVADLFWREKKLVFEIQCSPISPLEAQSRMDDYQKEGIEVVWLLDERVFNQKKISPAEQLMRSKTCYFFSMSSKKIYDQFELLLKNKRVVRGPPLEVDLASLSIRPPKQQEALPQTLSNRNSHLVFRGDLWHRCLSYPQVL